MSLSLIRSMGQTITVLSDKNPEVRVRGKRVADVWTSRQITASVQPMQGDEIQQELGASAERNSDGVKVYSFDELKTVRVQGGFKADRVEYLGEIFEVVKVQKFIDNRMNLVHYKSICVKVNLPRVS